MFIRECCLDFFEIRLIFPTVYLQFDGRRSDNLDLDRTRFLSWYGCCKPFLRYVFEIRLDDVIMTEYLNFRTRKEI